MVEQCRIFFQPPADGKIHVIKTIRATTGMGLKDSKDACDQGYIDVVPEDAHRVSQALWAVATNVNYDPPLEMRVALGRLQAVGTRFGTRLVDTLATGLERIEARLWGVK